MQTGYKPRVWKVFDSLYNEGRKSKPLKTQRLQPFVFPTKDLRLIDLHLRTTIDSNFVKRTKLIYIKGNFVESALHDNDSNIWDVTSHDDKNHARCVIRMGIMG